MLRSYRIKFSGGEVIVPSHNRRSATYAAYLKIGDVLGGDFGSFLRRTTVKSLGPFKPEHLNGANAKFQFLKESRQIPFAHLGQRVILHHEEHDVEGIIVGVSSGSRLEVCVGDGDGRYRVCNAHPLYHISYLGENGEVVGEFV